MVLRFTGCIGQARGVLCAREVFDGGELKSGDRLQRSWFARFIGVSRLSQNPEFQVAAGVGCDWVMIQNPETHCSAAALGGLG